MEVKSIETDIAILLTAEQLWVIQKSVLKLFLAICL